ncbi:hypothetical protein TRFO_24071 [Tritrichomonas foetus]|uniref:Transmembrane protein n=1 Tax=Tritrichomonas foetus TaxID=1144522 RepID=A0A1J4KDF8_9EUKA|nr:hypothetical protein TRFO_24071 [Tritrichomonas foetus]|eukprot:OHT07662.1 hypothetical protein TRFO_24071 [Tritrichomonas foetus]
MILCLLFVISSTLFGSSVIIFIRNSPWLITMQTFAGWSLGSMLISVIGFVSTYFTPLTFTHTIFLLVSQFVLSIILIMIKMYISKQPISKIITIKIEYSSSFFLVLAIVGFLIIKYENQSYYNFPDILPSYGRQIFELEHSFVSSILSGVNYKRKNFILFSDPYLMNQTYVSSALPHIYTSYLISLGVSYPDASAIISFMNTLSTVSAVFLYGHLYAPNYQYLIVLIYLFNGGSSLFNLKNGNLFEYDGVHNTERGETPHFQIFAIHLGLSKTSSFSIPLAIYALSFLQATQTNKVNFRSQYILSGLFASLIPSFSTSIAFFICGLNYYFSFTTLLPFVLTILPKFYKSYIRVYPLWREYQMQGIFFSQIITFIDSIGIQYIFLFFVPFLYKDYIYFHRILTCLASFAYLCFFREGNDSFANDIAISAIFLPVLAGNFIKIMVLCRKWLKSNQQLMGITNFVFYSLIGLTIFSGIVSINSIVDKKTYGLDKYSLQCGLWVSKHLRFDEMIMSSCKGMNPAVLSAGRQTFMGSINDLWIRGEIPQKQAELFEEITSDRLVVDFMRNNSIKYLLEYKADPFLINNNTYAQKFRNVEENLKWKLLVLY